MAWTDRERAGLFRLRRMLREFRDINPRMTLMEALILLDVADGEGSELTAEGQPTIGVSIVQLSRTYAPDKSRQIMNRTINVLASGYDNRGCGDGIRLVETFDSPHAADKRVKFVRLTQLARQDIASILKKVVPLDTKEHHDDNQLFVDTPNESVPGKRKRSNRRATGQA